MKNEKGREIVVKAAASNADLLIPEKIFIIILPTFLTEETLEINLGTVTDWSLISWQTNSTIFARITVCTSIHITGSYSLEKKHIHYQNMSKTFVAAFL